MTDNRLTKAEEEIMHILWKEGKAFVKDIVAQFPDPKPAYNTVSTIVRILEKKKFVGYKAFGRSHEYYPLVSKDIYTKLSMKDLVKGYFNGSYEKMLSFFVNEKNISVKELERILNQIEKP